jgi:hypothetical protein
MCKALGSIPSTVKKKMHKPTTIYMLGFWERQKSQSQGMWGPSKQH